MKSLPCKDLTKSTVKLRTNNRTQRSVCKSSTDKKNKSVTKKKDTTAEPLEVSFHSTAGSIPDATQTCG